MMLVEMMGMKKHAGVLDAVGEEEEWENQSRTSGTSKTPRPHSPALLPTARNKTCSTRALLRSSPTPSPPAGPPSRQSHNSHEKTPTSSCCSPDSRRRHCSARATTRSPNRQRKTPPRQQGTVVCTQWPRMRRRGEPGRERACVRDRGDRGGGV